MQDDEHVLLDCPSTDLVELRVGPKKKGNN